MDKLERANLKVAGLETQLLGLARSDLRYREKSAKLQAENKRLKEANELFGCPGCPTFKECQFAEKCRQCWNLGEMAREVKERQALQEKK